MRARTQQKYKEFPRRPSKVFETLAGPAVKLLKEKKMFSKELLDIFLSVFPSFIYLGKSLQSAFIS